MAKIRDSAGRPVPEQAPASAKGRRRVIAPDEVPDLITQYRGNPELGVRPKGIRTLATERGVAYGTVHATLREAGVIRPPHRTLRNGAE